MPAKKKTRTTNADDVSSSTERKEVKDEKDGDDTQVGQVNEQLDRDDTNADEYDADVSDYERIRSENIKRNSAFLSTLGLDANRNALEEGKVQSAHVPSRRGTFKASKAAMMMNEPVRRSGRVTIEKLKLEIEKLKGGSSAHPETNDVLLSEKEAALNDMIAKKAEGSYDVNLDAMVTASQNNYQPTSRLPSDPVPLATSVLNISPELQCIEVKKLITTLSSCSAPRVTGAAVYNKSKGDSKFETSYKADIRKLGLNEVDVAKVTESRVTSVFCHPSHDKVIVAAGDKNGFLGLWDVNTNDGDHGGVYRYRPHVSNIAAIHAWADCPSKLFSVSYDGTIRYLDLEKEVFSLGFEIPEDMNDVYLTDASFAWSNTSTALVARSDGQVALVDFRNSSTSTSTSAGRYAWKQEAQDAKLNSVQFHPTHEHLVICSGSGKSGSITVHDMRSAASNLKGKWKSLIDFNGHSKSINAAYASPDGQYLVSVSQDNTVKTWKNFTQLALPLPPVCSTVRHDNHTGRWLSTFRPAWDPKHPHALVLGSMDRPRCIEVFAVEESKAGAGASHALELVKAIKADFLGSVCSRNCFHPTLNLIVGCNSSGRLHVLR